MPFLQAMGDVGRICLIAIVLFAAIAIWHRSQEPQVCISAPAWVMQ